MDKTSLTLRRNQPRQQNKEDRHVLKLLYPSTFYAEAHLCLQSGSKSYPLFFNQVTSTTPTVGRQV